MTQFLAQPTYHSPTSLLRVTLVPNVGNDVRTLVP